MRLLINTFPLLLILILQFCPIKTKASELAMMPKNIYNTQFIIEIGEGFYNTARNSIVNGWLDGRARIVPETILDPSDFLDNWILNQSPKSWKQDLLSNGAISLTDQVNAFNILVHSFNYCQGQNVDACKKVVFHSLGLALVIRYNLKEHLSGANENDGQKLYLRALDQLNSSIHADPYSVIIGNMLSFEKSKSTLNLRRIAFEWSKESQVFEFNDKLKSSLNNDNEIKKAINEFIVLTTTLRYSLSKTLQEDTYRTTQIAATRMEELYPKLLSHLELKQFPDQRDQFDAPFMYNALGVLEVYYKEIHNYISLSKTTTARGWIRAQSFDLTPSCTERFFLKLWGGLTEFGTNIIRPTLFILTWFFTLLLALIIFRIGPNFSLQILLSDFMGVLTFSKPAELNCWFFSLWQIIYSLYSPLYFGYFVSFLLQWK